MKKLVLLFMLLFATGVSWSQNNLSAVPDGTGTVYFLRSTGYTGSATAFTVFIDDSIVCRLNNKRFSIHNVPAGKRIFSTQFAGKKSKEKAERIDIEIEAGKTYYIQLIFQSGLLANNLYCQEVTESSAKKVLSSLQEDKKCL